MNYLMGIDVSTTGCKALIIDASGKVLAASTTPYALSSPKPLWSEQNPHDWWEATIKSIRSVIEQSEVPPQLISAIGLTGQMHGLVLLDAAGEVLRPAILWNDQRTQAQCDEIHEKIGRKQFIQISGNLALTGFTAPKVLWVAENEPDVYARARHILLPKDYIRYRLTDDFAMDKADGSGTVLFDIKRRDWSMEILNSMDIPHSWLPDTYEGPEITGMICGQASEMTGLATTTRVVAGGGDQSAQAVGVGAVESGIIGLTVGTSGVVFAPTQSALIEPNGKLHSFCHAVPGMWHLMGVMLSAAGSLQWYRETLAADMSFDDLLREAENIPAGSEGLQFLPYLSGERTPYPDPNARGAFIGLTLKHNRAHMTRALLEGVAFGLKDCFNLVRQASLGKIEQVRASGGGTKSPLWRQIMASVLENELVVTNTTEGAAYGAALLAGVGVGLWIDVQQACKATIKVTNSSMPSPEQVDKYRKVYAVYQELYPALKPLFRKLAE